MRPIAVLDDDEEFCAYLAALLSSKAYKVAQYATAGRLLDGLVKAPPALLVLDVNLPGMDGLELLRVIKRNKATERLPVIVVSGEAVQTKKVVQGLDEGADEYFSKPLDAQLFLARVENLLNRAAAVGSAPPAPELLAAGRLRMDLSARSVTIGPAGKPLPLTRLQFDLLEYFFRNPGRIVTRGMLMQEVWPSVPDISVRTVDKHVENLRRKLGPCGGWIKTMVKAGYVFQPKIA